MKKPTRRTQLTSTLPSIIGVLLISAVLRIGGVGIAIANETPESITQEMPQQSSDNETIPGIERLLKEIDERTIYLDNLEYSLAKKQERLNAVEVLIETNLAALIEAEERLAETISKVDGASEADLDRLTSVYESMKPKGAAALFESMEPEFAAGFLGRMNPQAAAGIMSNLSTEAGYAISVVLAGRNALAPTQ